MPSQISKVIKLEVNKRKRRMTISFNDPDSVAGGAYPPFVCGDALVTPSTSSTLRLSGGVKVYFVDAPSPPVES